MALPDIGDYLRLYGVGGLVAAVADFRPGRTAIYDTNQAAALLNVTPECVRHWIKIGHLLAHKRDQWCIRDRDLAAFQRRELARNPYLLTDAPLATFAAPDDPLAPVARAGDLVVYETTGAHIHPNDGLVAVLLAGGPTVRRWRYLRPPAGDFIGVEDAAGGRAGRTQAPTLGNVAQILRPCGDHVEYVPFEPVPLPGPTPP